MILVTAKEPADCQYVAKEIENMARAYDILRKMENGELLPIASRGDLEEAKQLAESLNSYWPADYIVRESESGVEFPLKHERPADWPRGAHKPEYLI